MGGGEVMEAALGVWVPGAGGLADEDVGSRAARGLWWRERVGVLATTCNHVQRLQPLATAGDRGTGGDRLKLTRP